jgi:hypothetical protein
MAVRVCDAWRAVARAGLGVQVVDVTLDGRLAHREPRRDLGVRQTIGAELLLLGV